MSIVIPGRKTHIEFDPNAAQERCLRAMRPGDRMFWRSGVGTGKTSMVQFISQRLAHLNPGTPGLIVSHNLVHVETEIIDPLIGMLKQAETYKGRNLRLRRIYLNNGSSVQWAGAHKPESIDGKNVGWGLGDEVRYWPEASYTKFVSRIRVQCPWGFEGVFTTPELNWIARVFKDSPDFKEIVARTIENEANLQPGFYERLRRTLSPELYESYVNGEWLHTGGGVFPEYKENIHTSDPDLYVPGHPVHVGFDPAAQLASSLFFQHFHWCERHQCQHCVHVLDQLNTKDLATVWVAEEWKRIFYERAWRWGTVYHDPAGDARGSAMGISDSNVLRGMGWECQRTTDPFKRSVMTGIQAIKGKLKPFDGSPPSLYFHPRLLDDPSERGIIVAMVESKYPDIKTGSTTESNPIKDGWIDHARDCLRYIVVNLCPLPAVSGVTPARSANRSKKRR